MQSPPPAPRKPPAISRHFFRFVGGNYRQVEVIHWGVLNHSGISTISRTITKAVGGSIEMEVCIVCTNADIPSMYESMSQIIGRSDYEVLTKLPYGREVIFMCTLK